MPGLDQDTRVYVRTPENAYKLFAQYNGRPHGDLRFASGQVAYDVEFPTVLDAAICAKTLGQWFTKADLRYAVSVAFSDRPVTSLEQAVVMTFVCY